MSKHKIYGSIIISILLFSSACAISEEKYKVRWYNGLDLYFFVENEKPATEKLDIERQLKGRWSSPAVVYTHEEARQWYESWSKMETPEEPQGRIVSSCDEFMQARQAGLSPVAESKRNTYAKRGLLCIAGKLTLSAKDVNISYLDDLRIDKKIASHIPAKFGYFVNPKEIKDFGNKSWADIEKMTSSSVKKNEEVKFESKYAIHFVEKIASGDFDGDGVEDFLLDIVHGSKEGTHAIEFLLLVTRLKEGGAVKVIKSYSAFDEN
ncbi:hypothetical protein ACQV5M_19310 [Leptospira sp. SA-E8]|uniref:hypothetical protein n=1 Tax=Leptospira sp. SA-E8 TaxID=3422259 RepID=UPI003EBF2A2E